MNKFNYFCVSLLLVQFCWHLFSGFMLWEVKFSWYSTIIQYPPLLHSCTHLPFFWFAHLCYQRGGGRLATTDSQSTVACCCGQAIAPFRYFTHLRCCLYERSTIHWIPKRTMKRFNTLQAFIHNSKNIFLLPFGIGPQRLPLHLPWKLSCLFTKKIHSSLIVWNPHIFADWTWIASVWLRRIFVSYTSTRKIHPSTNRGCGLNTVCNHIWWEWETWSLCVFNDLFEKQLFFFGWTPVLFCRIGLFSDNFKIICTACHGPGVLSLFHPGSCRFLLQVIICLEFGHLQF